MKFYLAGPVITDKECVKFQMNDIEKALHSIILPNNEIVDIYRPGKHKVPNAWGIDMKTWAQCVFTMDVIAIDECDWMVLADYGREATAGTSWEAGYAFAKGIKILVIQMPGVKESSLMTQGCAANICKYEDFISGVDYNGGDSEIYKAIWGTKFEKFFFERGRQQNDFTLN